MHKDGSLDSFESMQHDSSLTYTFDPDDPVPTIGGQLVGMFEIIPPEEGGFDTNNVPAFMDQWTHARNNLREVVAAGGWHQKEGPQWSNAKKPYKLLKERPDVLAFETDPLEDLSLIHI